MPRSKAKTETPAPPVEDQGGTAAIATAGVTATATTAQTGLAATTIGAGDRTECGAPVETNTGTLDVSAEATSGDGGAREIEVSAATERLEGMADDIEFSGDPGLLVAEMTNSMVDQFRNRPKPWGQMSQTEQRDVIAALEHNAKEVVRQAVEIVASNGKAAIRCLLVGFTDKGDDIKAELKVKALSTEETELAVVGLHRARGKLVMLTVASADDYHTAAARDISEPEQQALGFEAGNDLANDEDLAAADLEQPADELPAMTPEQRAANQKDVDDHIDTGDIVLITGGLGEARINLKTGLVEALPAGCEDADANWVDVREATPDELAAERERTADFVDA